MTIEELRQQLPELLVKYRLNTSEIARQTHYCRASILWHIKKVKEQTGKDLMNVLDLVEVLGYEKVVRCKDCKHRVERGMCYMISGSPELVGVGDDFWCAYGERKDDDDG